MIAPSTPTKMTAAITNMRSYSWRMSVPWSVTGFGGYIELHPDATRASRIRPRAVATDRARGRVLTLDTNLVGEWSDRGARILGQRPHFCLPSDTQISGPFVPPRLVEPGSAST